MADQPKRRELQFNSLDEAVADAEQLAQGKVRVVGQHSFAEILEHLALTHDMVTGKVKPPRLPFYMRMLMPFMRSSILKGPAKPGFKLPARLEAFFWKPNVTDVGQSLAHLKESVENYHAHGPLPIHPIFGKATAEQVNKLTCSHAAMHLSFVHPVSHNG